MKIFGIILCIFISINAYSQTCCVTKTNCSKIDKSEAQVTCLSTTSNESKQLEMNVAKIETKSNLMQLTTTFVASVVSKLSQICDPKNCDPTVCDPSKCDPSKCDPGKCDWSKCPPASCKKS